VVIDDTREDDEEVPDAIRDVHWTRLPSGETTAAFVDRILQQTYDRMLGDLLQLQTDIAAAVVSALKVTLLADVAQTIAVGATANPAAFDAYLRGRAIAAGRAALSGDRARVEVSRELK